MSVNGKVYFNGENASELPAVVGVTVKGGNLATGACASYSVVDVATDSTTVYNGPAVLYGVYVNTVLSAHALPIKDGTTTVLTLPASAAAGSMYTFPGIVFGTSLVVDPNDSGTGNVTVVYRAG